VKRTELELDRVGRLADSRTQCAVDVRGLAGDPAPSPQETRFSAAIYSRGSAQDLRRPTHSSHKVAPLDEQRRMVAMLVSIDRKIDT
jgi:hypothetical protein